jgi:hypothetical protein
MKVTSPIGKLPFTVTGIRLERSHLIVDGELGAWRSHIEVGADDVPMLARALRGPLIAAGVAVAGLVLARRL